MQYRVIETGNGYSVVFTLEGNVIRVIALRDSRVSAVQYADELNRFARLFDTAHAN